MSLFHRGQHALRLPAEIRPAPPDVTRRFATVTLLDPPRTSPRPVPVPAREAIPAPVPIALPAPPPPPRRRRPGWIPARPIRITEAAVLACPGGQVPAIFTLPCPSCHRVHTRGGTSSFGDLYAHARQAGWRTDTLGVWACPPCQAKPGWRAPRLPAPAPRREYALITDVTARRAPAAQVLNALRSPAARHQGQDVTMATVGLVVGVLLAGIAASAFADRHPAFGCWWFGSWAIACVVLAVVSAMHGDWGWAAWMAFLGGLNGRWWWDCFRRWRRRRRRALAAMGAKSRARLAAVVVKHRAAQRRTRPVLRPVPGAAA